MRIMLDMKKYGGFTVVTEKVKVYRCGTLDEVTKEFAVFYGKFTVVPYGTNDKMMFAVLDDGKAHYMGRNIF